MTPVDQFSALADPTRCKVIEMLHERPMPVHELTAAFDISRPAISRHLRVLKDARLVKEEKQGRENIYSLQRGRLKPMSTWLEKLGPKPAVKAEPVVEAAPAPAPKPKAKAVAPKPVVAKPVVAPRAPVVPKAPPPQMQLDLF
jgi:DNA-binding transcriptional ArsR family regulator